MFFEASTAQRIDFRKSQGKAIAGGNGPTLRSQQGQLPQEKQQALQKAQALLRIGWAPAKPPSSMWPVRPPSLWVSKTIHFDSNTEKKKSPCVFNREKHTYTHENDTSQKKNHPLDAQKGNKGGGGPRRETLVHASQGTATYCTPPSAQANRRQKSPNKEGQIWSIGASIRHSVVTRVPQFREMLYRARGHKRLYNHHS